MIEHHGLSQSSSVFEGWGVFAFYFLKQIATYFIQNKQ